MCQLATRVVTTEPSANRDARGFEPRSAPHEPGAGQSASRVCFPNPWSQDTCYGLAGALDRRSRVEPPLPAGCGQICPCGTLHLRVEVRWGAGAGTGRFCMKLLWCLVPP